MGFFNAEEEAKTLAKSVLANPDRYSEETLTRSIMEIRARCLPVAESLTITEFNWLVEYVTEAREKLKPLIKKNFEKL